MGHRHGGSFLGSMDEYRPTSSAHSITSVFSSFYSSTSSTQSTPTAPEYALDEVLVTASDMYSLGAVIYAVHCRGKPPFQNHASLGGLRDNAGRPVPDIEHLDTDLQGISSPGFPRLFEPDVNSTKISYGHSLREGPKVGQRHPLSHPTHSSPRSQFPPSTFWIDQILRQRRGKRKHPL